MTDEQAYLALVDLYESRTPLTLMTQHGPLNLVVSEVSLNHASYGVECTVKFQFVPQVANFGDPW